VSSRRHGWGHGSKPTSPSADPGTAVSSQRVEAEQTLAGLRERAERAAEAGKVAELISAGQGALANLDASLRAFAGIFAGIGSAGEMSARAAWQLHHSVTALAGTALGEAELYRAGLLEGSRAISRPRPAITSEPELPAIPCRAVYALAIPLLWRINGEEHRCPPYSQAHLPECLIPAAHGRKSR
jgi:hypothetical protein